METAIHVSELRKRFRNTQALDGVNFTVEPGTVFGLLGPNGAGKTTIVNILSTLLSADSGQATVAGFNVAMQPDLVRASIGLTGQYASVDDLLTGRRNLELIGRLYHLPAKEAHRRAEELLNRFSLADAGDRLAREYSGGMRRRLDLAASLVAEPDVLFLDEPTTGLDPRSRLEMWATIRDLVRGGTTLLLTTQYLEEADQLADTIAVIDRGTIIAQGTPNSLKSSIGNNHLELTLGLDASVTDAVQLIHRVTGKEPVAGTSARNFVIPLDSGSRTLMDVITSFDAASIRLESFGLRQPTLDEVFLHLTGKSAAITEPELEFAR